MIDKDTIDYTKLPPDMLKLLEEVEKNSPQERQLRAIAQLSKLTQLMLDALNQLNTRAVDDSTKAGEQFDELKSLLASLDKEPQELPDFSKPIISAVKELEKSITTALKKIDVKPEVNSPDVNITAPEVDLTELTALIRESIPRAFQEAISLIPQPETPEPLDITPIQQALNAMSEQLESVDVGVRMKPQFPTTLKVTNTDGSAVNSDIPLATKITTSGTDTYVGEALPGSSQAAAVWRIQKIDNDGNVTWKDGDSEFDNTATDLTAGSFS